jgi:hypothetical protein
MFNCIAIIGSDTNEYILIGCEWSANHDSAFTYKGWCNLINPACDERKTKIYSNFIPPLMYRKNLRVFSVIQDA